MSNQFENVNLSCDSLHICLTSDLTLFEDFHCNLYKKRSKMNLFEFLLRIDNSTTIIALFPID